VACIPKETFSRFGYLSKPFGIPLNVSNEKEILERCLNDDKAYWQDVPQVRLLAHHLVPSEMTTLVFPTMDDSKFFDLVFKIRSLSAKYKSHEFNHPFKTDSA